MAVVQEKQQSRFWCFTDFYVDDEPVFVPSKMNYLIYAMEKCPTTKRLHFQGYMEFHKKQRQTAVVKFLSSQCRVFCRAGTQAQAIGYVKKPESKDGVSADNNREHGKPDVNEQGKRNDLHEAVSALKKNNNLREVAMEHTSVFVKFHSGLQKLSSMIYKNRDKNDPPDVYWIYGPSGVGKSRTVWDMFKPDEVYPKDPMNKWWDGYVQQPVILIDEYKGGWEPSYLLRVIDRYPMTVEIKGGSMPLNSPVIVITSVTRPSDRTGEITRRVKFISMGEGEPELADQSL